MKFTIEALRGVWRAQVENRTEFADTLEELLLRLAPEAPEEYVWHAAEVLGAILGAEVVESSSSYQPQYTGDDFRELFAAMLPDTVYEKQWNQSLSLVDELLEERRAEAAAENDEQGWQPTEAQQAYFEPERSEEAGSFDPDTQPRGV